MNVEPLLAFFSGVGVTLTGALVANVLSRQRERRRFVEDRRFEIYMKLMELYGSYFWFTVAEMHHEPVSDDLRRKCRDLAWQIADVLRSADEVEYLDDILDITLGPSFSTARDRYDAMGKLLDRLGERVNPRYSKKIRDISEANIRVIGAGGKSNAPGATSFFAS